MAVLYFFSYSCKGEIGPPLSALRRSVRDFLPISEEKKGMQFGSQMPLRKTREPVPFQNRGCRCLFEVLPLASRQEPARDVPCGTADSAPAIRCCPTAGRYPSPLYGPVCRFMAPMRQPQFRQELFLCRDFPSGTGFLLPKQLRGWCLPRKKNSEAGLFSRVRKVYTL